jgi:hypothetical protein
MKTEKQGNLFITLVTAGVLGGVGYWLWKNSRWATRTPGYGVVRREGPVEIRDYPRMTVVEAGMREEGEAGVDGSFMKLFRYIAGGNERAEKIAMTTPVLMGRGIGGRTMGFILPEGVGAEDAARPADESVSVGEIEGGRFAVMRFEGRRSHGNEVAAEERLRAWMRERGMEAEGAPLVAYYDPPWTPVWLRRNEVMIKIAESDGEDGVGSVGVSEHQAAE